MNTINIATVSKAENLENFDIIGEVNGEVKSLPYSQLKEQINNLQNQLDQMWKNIYPVGAIYISVNSTSPGTLFGGTWERIQDRFLLCAGSSYSAGSTGGSTTHNHPLGDSGWIQGIATGSLFLENYVVIPEYNAKLSFQYAVGQNDYNQKTVYGIPLAGNTENQTIIPPYLSVYVWKRTA